MTASQQRLLSCCPSDRDRRAHGVGYIGVIDDRDRVRRGRPVLCMLLPFTG